MVKYKISEIEIYTHGDATPARGAWIGIVIVRGDPSGADDDARPRPRHYRYYPPNHPHKRQRPDGDAVAGAPRQIGKTSMRRLTDALDRLYEQRRLLGMTWFSGLDDTLNGFMQIIPAGEGGRPASQPNPTIPPMEEPT